MNGKYRKLALLSLISLNFSAFGVGKYKSTIEEHVPPAITGKDISKLDKLIKRIKDTAETSPPLLLEDFDGLANVDYMDIKNNTMLAWALFTNKIYIAKKLLNLNANPNLIGNLGAPIHIAANMHNFEMVRDLIEAGANPNVKDKEGKTIYEKATASGFGYLLPDITEEDTDNYDWLEGAELAATKNVQ